MTLQVFTARISCRDPDRFDITRKSGGAAVRVFAPSWKILGHALEARRAAAKLLADHENMKARSLVEHPDLYGRTPWDVIERNLADRAAKIELEAWTAYVPAYIDEMAESEERHPEAWASLLARERVVLCCYCQTGDPPQCHRWLLAGILASRGAVECGEFGLATASEPLFAARKP